MLGGFKGNILRVNLSRMKFSYQKLNERYAKEYLGGSGLATRFLIDEFEPKVDPLAPENRLVFMTGPLTGTNAPCCGRYTVVSKSPLTGFWAESGSGGYWGPELKFAGFDGIIIEGKARDPVYLWINEKQIEIRNADHLWGNTVDITENIIRKDLEDEKIRIACIGPAGEKLARIACIINDAGRAAGRCGLGAVMGSKNLKAIAVRGTTGVEVADEASFLSTAKKVFEKIKASPSTEFSRKYGTSGYVEACEAIGDLPIKNWTEHTWEGAEKISGQRISDTILKRPYTCYLCPIACGKIIEIKSGPYLGVEGHGPEYETCASFGSLLLNDDLDTIAKCNDLCNKYGLDTISCGGVIAFTMECYEKGIITREDIDGLDPTWGNSSVVVELARKIGTREGIGFLLGEGIRFVSEKFGGHAKRFAMHVKGLELPMHDPRAYESLALGYATSNRGACHLAAASHWVEGGSLFPEVDIVERQDRFSSEGKAGMVVKMQNIMSIADSLVVCKFALTRGFSLSFITEILSATTGVELAVNDLVKAGERIFNLKRIVNNLLGVSRKDDTLPERILQPGKGSAKWHVPDLQSTLNEYYRIRGWDKEGRPTKAILHDLDLAGKCERKL